MKKTDTSPKLQFFAPCPRGAETLLVQELQTIGASDITASGGGVGFTGAAAIGWLANLTSRIASRILQKVAHGQYRSTDDIYNLAKNTEWEQWHDAQATLRVDLTATRSPLQSLQFATLRIKDGVCDRHREISGERPSVDTHRPARRIMGFVNEEYCTLYLDWSGEPLFKRGWREQATDAPLKENLAATLLMLANWPNAETVLLDPFCGSGTIAIEAALMAHGALPGAKRHFAFEQHKTFDASAWQKVRDRAISEAMTKAAQQRAINTSTPSPVTIIASDISEAAIAIAKQNAMHAGLPSDAIDWRQIDVLHWQSPAPAGLMLSNPPYGERLDTKGRKVISDNDQFWPAFGTLLKQQFAGWRAALLTSDLELPGQIRLKAVRRTPLFNGPLECRLFSFEMYAGSRRKPAAETAPL